jgi:hypothetical protein
MSGKAETAAGGAISNVCRCKLQAQKRKREGGRAGRGRTALLLMMTTEMLRQTDTLLLFPNREGARARKQSLRLRR